MANYTSYDDDGFTTLSMRGGSISNIAQTQRMIAQNLEILHGRARVVNTLEQLEKKLAERKEQLAILQKTTPNDVNRIAKVQEIIKNLEDALSRSPVYQEILLKRKQKAR